MARKTAAEKATEATVEQTATVPGKATPQPGDVIKTYIQNGLRYKRVVQDNGETLDVRG